MLDKAIIDRLEACFKKVGALQPSGNCSILAIHENLPVQEKTNLAIALFKEGYKGKQLSLIENIEFLKAEHSGYIMAGWPGFMGLFGRDSLITAWQLLDYDPLIARNTLLVLAEYQGTGFDCNYDEEPGKILHEFYPETTDPGWYKKYKGGVSWLEYGKPFYYSLDSTPLFLFVFAEYYKKTHDTQLAGWLSRNISSALNWLFEHADKNKDGFVDYEQCTDSEGKKKGLLHQSWKDSEEYQWVQPIAPVEIQGYVYAAVKNIHSLDFEEWVTPEMYQKNLKLKQKFNNTYWADGIKYFCFGLDGKGKKIYEVTSNPGHLLFTGILDKDKADTVVEKLFSEYLWTPFGIRTHSVESDLFNAFSYHCGSVWPHDNWIIAQGLKKMGYDNEYQQVKKALFNAYDTLGYIPEQFGVTLDNEIIKLRSQYPQAWASGALLNFLMEETNE